MEVKKVTFEEALHALSAQLKSSGPQKSALKSVVSKWA